MPEGWLTFTDFRSMRAIAVRAPVDGHWDGITLTDDSGPVKVWRTQNGRAAVVEMDLNQRSGDPIDEFGVVDGIRLADLLHSPTLGPSMIDGVIWSRLKGAGRDFAAAAGIAENDEARE